MKPNFTTKAKFARKNRETLLPSPLARAINDIVGILLIALALLISLALATHSSLDDNWSHAQNIIYLHNKAGVLGANISDILFYGFGYSAWWIALGVLFLGAYKLKRQKITTGNWITILKVFSFLVLIFASVTFENLAFTTEDLPARVVGNYLLSLTIPWVGISGVAVISLVLIVVCISGTFNLSWYQVSQKVGFCAEFIFLKLVKLISNKEDRVDVNQMDDVNNKHVVNEEQTVIKANKLSWLGCFNKFFKLKGQDLELNESKEPELDLNALESLSVEVDGIKTNTIEDFNSELNLPLNETIKLKVAKSGKTKNHTALNSQVNLAYDLLNEKHNLPATNLLKNNRNNNERISQEAINYISATIENTLNEFGVEVKITNVEVGPVVTRYELTPPRGVRGDKIVSLAKEIARSLAMPAVRIVETIPGKNTMGIEVPNFKRQIIYLKEIFESSIYQNNNSLLTLALGRDITGEVVLADLAKMPHLLVAGTTGSGKSVAVNAMILSILFNATSEEVKFIMVDPKMVELSFYQGIPHLLAPVVTNMEEAANALRWAVGEMERRYKVMARVGTKNIINFNQKVKAAIDAAEPILDPFTNSEEATELEPWPYIVVIIDELADLMMVVGKKIEQYIARIAQKARAVGIHLIVATQRPSVDVITGLIKANIPARIAFQVSSRIDSRTILDQMGAESLLGQGDSLFLAPGSGFTKRVHGAFVNDDEIHQVINFLKTQGSPNYNEAILAGESDYILPGVDDDNNDSNNIEKDPIYDEAVDFIISGRRCSISALQTQFGIGYNKAARIMNYFEKMGLVKRTDKGGFELIKKS